jgi:hypothetical protein
MNQFVARGDKLIKLKADDVGSMHRRHIMADHVVRGLDPPLSPGISKQHQ